MQNNKFKKQQYQLETTSFPVSTKKKEMFFLRQTKGYVKL